jgi:ADP-heptose:LPS heptosyltransferase
VTGAARDDDDPRVLRLRPDWGFGDHLMLSAIIEGIAAERPDLRIAVAADRPEIFARNPHVAVLHAVRTLRRRDPVELARYREVTRRPPEARRFQTSGHLLDDMYASIGVALRERPHQPRLYLGWLERHFRARTLRALPRPRIAISAHGVPDVKLPNKIYPPDRWPALATALASLGGSVLQLGSRSEGPLLPHALDWRDLGYRRTAAVLARCDVLVTHVGGLMHLGAAMGVPAVVLYGAAEHPAVSGYPWNRNLYTPIVCGPCWLTTPCGHHSCMRRLAVDVVLAEVRAALAGAPAGTRELTTAVLT